MFIRQKKQELTEFDDLRQRTTILSVFTFSAFLTFKMTLKFKFGLMLGVFLELIGHKKTFLVRFF